MPDENSARIFTELERQGKALTKEQVKLNIEGVWDILDIFYQLETSVVPGYFRVPENRTRGQNY